MKIFKFLYLILFVFSIKAFSQENCNELLRQGVREYTKTKTYNHDYNETREQVKDIYNSYKEEKDVAKASAKYAGLFKGSGSYNAQEIEKIYKLYWSDELTISDVTNNSSYESTFIDPNFVAMYKECVKSNENKVKLNIDTYGNKLSSISVSAEYSSSDENSRPTINNINVDTSYVDISGTLWEAAKTQSKLNGVMSLDAARKSVNPKDSVFYEDLNKYVLAKPVRLTINFSSFVTTFIFPEIPLPPKEVLLKKGVGEIVASMLREDQFLTAYGSDWVLADGREAPINSPYRKFIAGSVPDLRGVFLRGKNHGRDSISGNPEEKGLGEFQDMMYQKHYHTANMNLGAEPLTGNARSSRAAGSHGATSPNWTSKGLVNEDGGNETRPKNVTINYFIRVR